MKPKIRYPNLAAEMARRGEKQKELATLLGISRGTVSRKMSGKTEFTIGEVEILCEHFKKNYYELFK